MELCGVLGGMPKLSHISRDEEYYIFPLEAERLSGAIDTINIVARKSILESVEIEKNDKLIVRGELRSFNNKSGTGNRLIITVFAREIEIGEGEDINKVILRGVLCKPPNLRKTPMGREICDLMLAVKRKYGRSDYLPCIVWGQNAGEAGTWKVGKPVTVTGRIQSRQYIKVEDGTSTERIAYEVSAISAEEENNDF